MRGGWFGWEGTLDVWHSPWHKGGWLGLPWAPQCHCHPQAWAVQGLFPMSLTSRAELRGNKKRKQPLKSPASPTCPLHQASQVKPSLSNCFFIFLGEKKIKISTFLASRHKASLPSPAGSFPERPGSPAGAGGHGQGVAQLHEEKDPAPGPAVAAGRPAPRAEAEGAATRPETRRNSLQGGVGVGMGTWSVQLQWFQKLGCVPVGFGPSPAAGLD